MKLATLCSPCPLRPMLCLLEPTGLLVDMTDPCRCDWSVASRSGASSLTDCMPRLALMTRRMLTVMKSRMAIDHGDGPSILEMRRAFELVRVTRPVRVRVRGEVERGESRSPMHLIRIGLA